MSWLTVRLTSSSPPLQTAITLTLELRTEKSDSPTFQVVHDGLAAFEKARLVLKTRLDITISAVDDRERFV
jgi:hypothetical protein